MEAFRFGFGPATPPAFKFDPTDDDIVAYYLLPRALGVLNPPFAHAVIDDNPASLPPPDLLALHNHAKSHHAFFLDVTKTKNSGRRERVIKGGQGGLWRGQQGKFHTLTLLSPGGREVDITYKRYDLTYKKFGDNDDDDEEEEVKGKKRKRKDGNGGTPSGWVMHEYTIVSPPLETTVLSRIHLTQAKIKENQQQAEAEAQQLNDPAADFNQHHQVFPAPQKLVPSYYQHDFAHQEQPSPSYNEDFPYQEQQARLSHLDMICGGNGFSDGRQGDDASFYGEEFPYQEQAGPSYLHFPVPEMPGPSHYHHHADMICGGTGFSDGTKADDASFYGEEFPYQEQAGPSYLPMPEQPGPSYYHHPANMMGGGEGFSDGNQADDASFYADDGRATGDGFVDLLCAGEGLADDNKFCEDGFHFTSGGDMEFTQGHCATQDTCPSKTDS